MIEVIDGKVIKGVPCSGGLLLYCNVFMDFFFLPLSLLSFSKVLAAPSPN